jgi:hypothetical protein
MIYLFVVLEVQKWEKLLTHEIGKNRQMNTFHKRLSSLLLGNIG